MKMTAQERLAIAEAAHAAQRAYRAVLDEAHADMGAAIAEMPEGTEFTASQIATAAGVPYQAFWLSHSHREKALRQERRHVTKKYAEILPDGSVDTSSTIRVTRRQTINIRTANSPIKYYNMGGHGDPSDILHELLRRR